MKRSKKDINKDKKSIGLSIVATTIVGLIILFILQMYVSLNYQMAQNQVSMDALFFVSLIGIFITGIIAEALVSKTKKPLTYGLASSTVAMVLIQLISTTVNYTFISSLNESPSLLFDLIISSVPLNMVMMFTMIFVAGLGVLAYWFFFAKTNEMEWIKGVFSETRKHPQKYLVTLILLTLLAVSMYLATEPWAAVIWMIVSAIALSGLIAYILNKFSIRNMGKVLLVSIISSIALTILVILPVLLVALALPDLLLLGLAINISIALGCLTIVALVLSPIKCLGEGVIASIRSSIKVARTTFFELVGMLCLLYLAIFTIQVLQTILGVLGAFVNAYLSIALELAISAYILELGILGLGKIESELGD